METNKEEKKELVSLIGSQLLLSDLKNSLVDWMPESKADAIKMLYLLSSFSTSEDDVKKKCYNYLSKGGSEQNHYLPELDLTANPVISNKAIYNTSEKVCELESEIKRLQSELKAAKEKSGVSHYVQTIYYKIKEG